MSSFSGKFEALVGYVYENENGIFVYQCQLCLLEFDENTVFERHLLDHKRSKVLDKAQSLSAVESDDRKYEQENININWTDEEIKIWPSDYDQYPQDSIRCVSSSFDRFENISEIFNTIRKICAPRLRSLSLPRDCVERPDLVNSRLHESDIQVIAKQIKNLEILHVDVRDADLILEHCRDIKFLMMGNSSKSLPTGEFEWMNRTYLELKSVILVHHISFRLEEEDRTERSRYDSNINIQGFLEMNPQLKFIFTNIFGAMEDICSTETKLSLVILRFDERDWFQEFYGYLRRCCVQENIKSFELLLKFYSADVGVLDLINNLDSVEGLHFSISTNSLEQCYDLAIKSKVKRVCLHLENRWKPDTGVHVANIFPNMNEFHLRFFNDCEDDDYYNVPDVDILMPIISQNKNLSDIHFDGQTITDNDIIVMNAARKDLQNPSKVIIHTPENQYASHQSYKSSEKSLVELRRNDEHDCPFCVFQLYDYNIPRIDRYLSKILKIVEIEK